MNKSNKIILISLLPVALTAIFVVYVMIPALQTLDDASKKLNEQKTAYTEAQSQLNILTQNIILKKSIEKLNAELSDFNYRFPPENELAIFLVDLEKYAKSYNVKVISLSSEPANSLKIEDPKQKILEEKNKNKVKKIQTQEDLPLNLSEIPVAISITGDYPNMVKFISFLQNYQRQIVIDGIKITNSKDDKNQEQNIKPKLEMEIKSKVYMAIEKQSISTKLNKEKI